MSDKVPILLSFYALTNTTQTLVFGQLTYTTLDDLTFKDYSRRKTFGTLLRLYRTKPFANQDIVLHFSGEFIPVKTDAFGSFYLKTNPPLTQNTLEKVRLASGKDVRIIEGLYTRTVQHVETDIIVVSDIDDTLIHSFIYRKVLKFKTLMFTTVEKRKTVVNMQELLQKFTAAGASSFYLSNSEQNLYPLIYRFLLHNRFPPGPLFLKKLRKLKDVILNIKFPLRNIHKEETLAEILSFFPEKKIVLMGDNTQHDLQIYLDAAKKFPKSIRYIIIRKVIEKKADRDVIAKAIQTLNQAKITLYYAEEFPHTFDFQS